MENNQKSENRAFYSFRILPPISFESSEPGEKVILLVRAHPFTQLSWVINAFLLTLFLVLVNVIIDPLLGPVQVLMTNIFGAVFIVSYMWYCFLNWYFNVGIITNKKVVDIDFLSIVYKEITIAQLNKIEDITVKSGGYFESFFDYGTIFIQTAGTEANVEFVNIPMPSEVARQINKLLGRKHGG